MSIMTPKINKKILIVLLLAFTALSFSFFYGVENVHAQFGDGDQVTFTDFQGGFEPPSTEGYAPGLTRVTTVRSFVLTFLNFALSFLGLLAVAVIIYGGFLYVTAAGDSEQSDKGKKSIQYALGGIIIILLSFGLVNTLITEPFSEGNLQLEGQLNGSAGTSGTQVVVSLNPLVSKVKTSATNLKTMYALYGEIITDIDAMRNDMEKPSVGENYSNIINFLENVAGKMDNMASKLEKHKDTQSVIEKLRNEINGASYRDKYEKAKAAKDEEVLADWEADTQSFSDMFDQIQEHIEDDLAKEIEDAKGQLNIIKNTIPQGNIGDESKIQNSIQSIIDTLLNNGQLGLDSIMPNLPAYQEMQNVMDLYAELYDALASMKSMQAGISADVVQGTAPLVVTFNMLSSSDPSGQSINDNGDSIIWDPEGLGDWDHAGELPNNDEATSCRPTKTGSLSFITCTFNKPGTYNSAVRIKTSDPGKYMDGIAILPIKVFPPTATLKLAVGASTGNQEKENLFEYDPVNNQPIFDKKSVKFTLNEAKSGIKFDPKGTVGTNGEANEIVSYYFNFGDSTDATGSDSTEVIHYYGEPGIYKVVYEVKDNRNQVNRKFFDLIVGSPVARISVSPGHQVFVGEEVFFNGTSSASETGQIVSYEWSIKGASTGTVTLEDKTQPTLNYVFTKDDTYTVVLQVKDSFNEPADTSTTIEVTSQPPVSKYTYDIPDNAQPATLRFFGSKSYDPDGNISDSASYNYLWKVEPNDGFKFIEGTSSTSLNPIIQFNKKNEYQVSFLVTDKIKKQGEAFVQSISINDILDAKWSETQDNSAQLNSDGEAQVKFSAESRNGLSYEIDFGDGETDGGDITNATVSTDHTYLSSGTFQVRLTVFDEDDNDRTITRRIHVGDGTQPLAAIKLFVDGQEIDPEDDQITVSRKSVITFDAGDSKNVDGTGRLLTYAWDFDDTGFSTQKTVTHTYKDTKSYYTVTLKVADKNDQGNADETTVKVKVVSLEPELSGLTVVPQVNQGVNNKNTDGLLTPLKVKVEAQGANDPDGEIVQYRWFYYDVKNSSDELGVQVTESKQAYLTIGTRGKENTDATYKFGVEMIDNENNKVKSADLLNSAEVPSIKVINGANEQPTARFKVDKTSIYVNESVTFTSEAQDPDGQIISYIWDVDGDGFSNDKTTEKSTYTNTYKKQAKDGLQVRLKVIDDKFGEATSDPITIYVQSRGEPPKAAFTFTPKTGTKVQFNNNSTSSSKLSIKQYKWDFDTSSNLKDADSDGDGVKDNDVDSTSKNPDWSFPDYGLYQVKLTVIDEDGNEDSVVNYVNIPKPTNNDLPKAAFKFTRVGDKKISFQNNSTNPTGPSIVKYAWDFDTSSKEQISDSDGDGVKDNDVDSKDKNPTFEYPNLGTYQVKLTVVDAAGAEDSVINMVEIAKIPLVNPQTGAVITPVDGNFTDGSSVNTLDAKLLSEPAASPTDNRIHLIGDKGNITFDFSTSTGAITKYVIDKNIFFDSDGNGVPNDDKNLEVPTPGKWTTDFDKSWGKTVVKLTVYDQYGNSDNVLKEVVFDSAGGADLFTSLDNNLWAALVSLLSFVILSVVLYKKTK